MDLAGRERPLRRRAASFVLACLGIGLASLWLRTPPATHDPLVRVYDARTGAGMHAVRPLVLDSDSSTNRTNWEAVRTPQLHAGLERVEAGARIPPHSHSTEEIVLVYDGRGYVLLDHDYKIAIQSGSLVHIPTGVRHEFHNAADHPMWLMWCFPTVKQQHAFQFRQRY